MARMKNTPRLLVYKPGKVNSRQPTKADAALKAKQNKQTGNNKRNMSDGAKKTVKTAAAAKLQRQQKQQQQEGEENEDNNDNGEVAEEAAEDQTADAANDDNQNQNASGNLLFQLQSASFSFCMPRQKCFLYKSTTVLYCIFGRLRIQIKALIVFEFT